MLRPKNVPTVHGEFFRFKQLRTKETITKDREKKTKQGSRLAVVNKLH